MNPSQELQKVKDIIGVIESMGSGASHLASHLLGSFKQRQQDLERQITHQSIQQQTMNPNNPMASSFSSTGGNNLIPLFSVGDTVQIIGGDWGRHGAIGVIRKINGMRAGIEFSQRSDICRQGTISTVGHGCDGSISNAMGLWVDINCLGLVINSSTSSTQMAGSKTKFTQGDRIYLMRVKDSSLCRYTDDDKLPVYGKDGNFIAGTVLEVRGTVLLIKWDNRHQNHLDVRGVELMTVEDAEASKKKKKNVKLDTVHLDKLVLKQEMKDEILSVLKQHEHSSKMFDDWGIGEIVEYGRGMTLCFWGGPGTGKTWGAHCISKALGKELLVISAGDIQSSEPGGANRAITEAFANAKKSDKVLFIDECDSLITVRSEVGMILASEINTLLTEIEKFEGVLILATNRIGMMDEALERRIALTIEFPEPDFDARVQIWKKMLPKKMPLHSNVLVDKLAEEKLTGGQIKNALLQAARLALAEDAKQVTMPHFEQAIKRIHKSRGVMGKGSNLMVAKSGTSKGRVVEMDKVSG